MLKVGDRIIIKMGKDVTLSEEWVGKEGTIFTITTDRTMNYICKLDKDTIGFNEDELVHLPSVYKVYRRKE